MQNILDLPRIKGTNLQKIHQFYEQLRYNVQSLETIGKLGVVRGNVALTIDKLAEIWFATMTIGKTGILSNVVTHWAPGYVEIQWNQVKIIEMKRHNQNVIK